jgi:hypothetical protein
MHLIGPPRRFTFPTAQKYDPNRFVENESELTTFDVVPVRPRHDGWAPEKQIAFIEALAETACVEEACRKVGLSRQSAYALRRRPCGARFRDAWDAALDYSLHLLEQAAVGRAINGVPRPVFYKGDQVGEYREHDERLAMFLLRYRRPARYGGWIDREPSPRHPEDEYPVDEAALLLDFHLDQIADLEPAPEGEGESPRAKGV